VEIPRRLGWVWRTRPEAPPDGLQAMLVRAANAATTGGNGVDFAANYRDWKQLLGSLVLPWTWLGPPASSDGLAAAEVVVEAAPGEPLYVVCIERGLPEAEAEAFTGRLRQLVPGALLGFSSYPTRGQAASFGVPWDACVACFDLGLPQVYFAGQRAELERVVADHRGRPLHVVVSPGDDAGWLATASVGLERHLGASIWRHGLDRFGEWARELTQQAAAAPADVAAATAPRGPVAPWPAQPAATAPPTAAAPTVPLVAPPAATAPPATPAAAAPEGTRPRRDGAAPPAGEATAQEAWEADAAGGAAALRQAAARSALALRAGEAAGETLTTAPPAAPRPARNGDRGRKGRGARASDRGEEGGSRPAGQGAPGGTAVAGAAPADDEPAGDEFDMATIADLENALRKVLNESAGRGQPSWAASQHAARTTLTDGEVAAIADAIAARLLDIPLGMVALDDDSISRVGDEVAHRVAGRLGPTVIRALREQFSRE
jgi:hypothetical protein